MDLFYSNERERLVCNYCEAVDQNLKGVFGDNKLVLYGGSTLYINRRWQGIRPEIARRITDIDFSLYTPAGDLSEKEEKELKREVHVWLEKIATENGFEAYIERGSEKYDGQVFFLLRNEEASIHVNLSGINRMLMAPETRYKIDGSTSNLHFLQPIDHLAYKIARIYRQANDQDIGVANPWKTPQDFLDVVNIMGSGLCPVKLGQDRKIHAGTRDLSLLRMLVVGTLAGIGANVSDNAVKDGVFLPAPLKNIESIVSQIQPLTLGRLEDRKQALSTKLCTQITKFFTIVSELVFPEGKMTENELQCLSTINELSGGNYINTRNRAAEFLAKEYPELSSQHPEIAMNIKRDSKILYAMRTVNSHMVE